MTTNEMEQCLKMIHRIAITYKSSLPPWIETDDLAAEGYLGIAESIARYEPARGAKFSTFCHGRCKGRMVDHVATECRHTKPLVGTRFDIYLSPEDGTESTAMHSELQTHLYQAVDRLPKLQRSTIKALLNGQTLTDLARAWGVTTRRLNQTYQRALIALRHALGDLNITSLS